MSHMDCVESTNTNSLANSQCVESIFGSIFYEENNLILFPNGIFGFPEMQNFLLSDIGQKKIKETFVLQPVPAIEHTFITMPLKKQNGYFKDVHIEQACHLFDIAYEDLEILGLLTFQTEGKKHIGFINLQAPILLDKARRVGYQHVLDLAYPIREEVMQWEAL